MAKFSGRYANTAGQRDVEKPSTRAQNAQAGVIVSLGDYEYSQHGDSFLGSGSFGEVYRGRDKHGGAPVAVKRLFPGVDLREAENEIRILESLFHPNLVGFITSMKDAVTTYIVMDLCVMNLGELQKHVGKFAGENAQHLVRHLASGYKALHDRSIIHRDIKPWNILMSHISDSDVVLKLADFGCSKTLLGTRHAKSGKGTDGYMAPEMGAICHHNAQCRYDYRADFWSLGIVFNECCGGEKIDYQKLNSLIQLAADKQISKLRSATTCVVAPDVDADLREIIVGFVKAYDSDRMSAEKFFNHSYVRRPVKRSGIALMKAPYSAAEKPLTTAGSLAQQSQIAGKSNMSWSVPRVRIEPNAPATAERSYGVKEAPSNISTASRSSVSLQSQNTNGSKTTRQDQATNRKQGESLEQAVFSSARDGNLPALKNYLEGKKQNELAVLLSAQTSGMPPLLIAAQNGHSDVCDYILSKGANVETKEDCTSLWCAAQAGHFKTCELLLRKYKANVNNATKTNSTPLRTACFYGHLEIVKLLVTNGADVEITNQWGSTPLMIACFKGHLGVVKYLLARGAVLNRRDEKGDSAIHYCAQGGNLDIMKLLVDKGADVEATNNELYTPLMDACENRHVDVVRYLLSRGVDVNRKREGGNTALIKCAVSGRLDILKLLVQKGGDLNLPNSKGTTVLMAASEHGHVDIVRYLLSTKEDVNRKDEEGFAAVHCAASNGRLEVIKLLCENGGRADIRNNNGATPLLSACYEGHADVVRYLLSHGANSNEKDDTGSSTLYYGAISGRVEILKVLVENGADIHAACKDGETPLMAACKKGHVECVRYLLSRGVDLHQKAEDGSNAVYFFVQVDAKTEILKLLREKGADIDLPRNDGATPLFAASFAGNVDVVQYLLLHGANVNHKTEQGFTALYAAAQEGKLDVVKLLVANGARPEERKGKDGFLPVEIAEENGHSEVASYLRNYKGKVSALRSNDGSKHVVVK